MQTGETRAREVIQADLMKLRTALNTGRRLNDPAEVYLFQKTLDRLEALAFAAPPAVERALHPALPLIEAIAKWERENGTLAAIMPSEYGDFCRLIADAAVHGYAQAVTLHPSDREAIARTFLAIWYDWHGEAQPWWDALDGAARSRALRSADAILALSGSLANPIEKDPL